MMYLRMKGWGGSHRRKDIHKLVCYFYRSIVVIRNLDGVTHNEVPQTKILCWRSTIGQYIHIHCVKDHDG